MAFFCLIKETDSPFNLTLLIICQSNANFKTEWVIQNELLPLKLGKSSIRKGFTWQGSDHFAFFFNFFPSVTPLQHIWDIWEI